MKKNSYLNNFGRPEAHNPITQKDDLLTEEMYLKEECTPLRHNKWRGHPNNWYRFSNNSTETYMQYLKFSSHQRPEKKTQFDMEQKANLKHTNT